MRRYLFLADKILPGLTNAARYPRYFALICAGIQLSGDKVDARITANVHSEILPMRFGIFSTAALNAANVPIRLHSDKPDS